MKSVSAQSTSCFGVVEGVVTFLTEKAEVGESDHRTAVATSHRYGGFCL